MWALERNRGTKRRKLPIGLFNHLTAHVGLQSFGNADAFGRLEVLEERGHNARQGERRSVECVAKLDLFCLRHGDSGSEVGWLDSYRS